MQNKVWMAGVLGAVVFAVVAMQAWSGGMCCGGKKAKSDAVKASCGTNACPAGMSKADCEAKSKKCHTDMDDDTNSPASSSDEHDTSGM